MRHPLGFLKKKKKNDLMQFMHKWSSLPRKTNIQASAGKVMATMFWDNAYFEVSICRRSLQLSKMSAKNQLKI